METIFLNIKWFNDIRSDFVCVRDREREREKCAAEFP